MRDEGFRRQASDEARAIDDAVGREGLSPRARSLPPYGARSRMTGRWSSGRSSVYRAERGLCPRRAMPRVVRIMSRLFVLHLPCTHAFSPAQHIPSEAQASTVHGPGCRRASVLISALSSASPSVPTHTSRSSEGVGEYHAAAVLCRHASEDVDCIQQCAVLPPAALQQH